MRPLHAAAAAAILLAMAAAILAGGHRLVAPGDGIVIAPEDIPDMPEPATDAGQEPDTAAIGPQAGEAPARSRAVDPETVAPPDAAAPPLERADPRPPLSDLALAQPPRPKTPDEWKGTPLFRPVATAAGIIEAKGYTVALSGIDIVKPDEACTDAAGKVWNCGASARTAFRAYLRGRAVTCAVPPEGGRDIIAAACSVGKQDLGAWLVENGWARAAPGGPYAGEGEAAARQEKGIFGAAPSLSGLPPAPPPAAAPAGAGSIIDLSGERPVPEEAPMPAPPPGPAQ